MKLSSFIGGLPRTLAAIGLLTGTPGIVLARDTAKPHQTQQKNAVAQALAQLQSRDEHLQSIGWKLITANAAFCPHPRMAIGLLLQDVAAFAKPDAVRAAMGLSGDIAVQAVAAGSPAQFASLPVHAEILAIDDEKMADLTPAGKKVWRRSVGLHQQINASLAATGSVTIVWQSGAQTPVKTIITGVPACSSRFEMIAGSRRASANGSRVAIGERFAGFTYSEEMFAAAIAHELAHNFLRHPAWLDANGRRQRNIRATEREADRLMGWLLANAGYDPAAGERFMRHWGPGHDGGILRARTHEGWDERAENIAAELPLIQQAIARDGKADWPRYFIRDIRPFNPAPAPPSSPVPVPVPVPE